jgi:hypothetical protein
MTRRVVATPYDCSPEEGLEAVAGHQGPLWIDLDETLYLHNSTADFLSHAWPGPLAFLLVKLVDLLGPWRLTGGASTRDTWRVAVVMLLMPWSLWHWRQRAGAARHEADPVLSQAFYQGQARVSYVQPWIWAAACGVGGLWLLRWPAGPVTADLLAWAGVLAATFAVYLVYNRVDKQTRLWLCPVLQAVRSGAFIAVTPATLIGGLAVAAHTFSRWVPYYTYRIVGVKWTKQPAYALRLAFFLLLAAAVAASTGTSVLTWEFCTLVAWFTLRAGKELWQIAAEVHWIADRSNVGSLASGETGEDTDTGARSCSRNGTGAGIDESCRFDSAQCSIGTGTPAVQNRGEQPSR